jgi:hypothetical protein
MRRMPVLAVVGLTAILTVFGSGIPEGQAQEPTTFDFSFRFPNPMVDRPNMYDLSPSAMLEGGNWRIWTCGLNPNTPDGRGVDAVYYNEPYTPNFNNGAGPKLVLNPSFTNTAPDGYFACAPNVVRHQWPASSGNKLLMYYECAPRLFPYCGAPGSEYTYCQNTSCQPAYRDGPPEICSAVSYDNGNTWLKFNSTYGYTSWAEPTPIIKATTQRNDCWITQQACSWVPPGSYPGFNNGYWARFTGVCGVEYGVGHPSAVVMNYGPGGGSGGQLIWLFYYDGAGPQGAGVYLKKSWDGMNFFGQNGTGGDSDPPWRTYAQGAPDVTYKPNFVWGGQNGYSVTDGGNDWWGGTFLAGAAQWFETSTDGLNWSPLRSFNVTAPGGKCFGATPLTNAFGQQTSEVGAGWFMTFLSSEGYFGRYPWEPLQNSACVTGTEPSCVCYSSAETPNGGRGNTWGVWAFQGTFH